MNPKKEYKGGNLMAKSVNMKVDFKKAKENQKILTGLVTGCDVVKVSETEVKYLLLYLKKHL